MKSLNEEFNAITIRTRRLIGGSTILHLLLLLLLMYYRTSTAAPEGITEITWIEERPPEPVVEQTAPPVAREEEKAAELEQPSAVPTREMPTEQFKRELKRSSVEPVPQTRSVDDVLSKRMETLDRKADASRTRMKALVTPPKVGSPSPVGLPKTAPAPKAQSDLRRSVPSPVSAPAELQRRPDAPRRPAALANPVTEPPTRGKAAPADASSSSTRNVAGAQLAGPVADRKLLSHQTPVYPEWAKQDGVEASVTLRFFVTANGLVKDNVLVEKTSGFRDFDNSSIAALLQWRFEALPGSSEQWGRITFHFRLSDSN